MLAGTSNARLYLQRLLAVDRELYGLQVRLRPKDGKTVGNVEIWFLDQQEQRRLWSAQFQSNQYAMNLEREARRKPETEALLIVDSPEYEIQYQPVSKDIKELTITLVPE